MRKWKDKNTARFLFNAAIITSLLLCLGFLGLIYKYKDEKSPSQVIHSVYYRIFGLPSVQWNSATPESEGLDTNKLEELSKSLEAYNTSALLVIRGGNIVFERYKGKQKKTTKYSTAAMAKAVTAGPVLLTAISEGRISIDDPLWKYYPELKNDPIRSKILIKHLVYHTSGIENVSFISGKHGKLTGWKAEYYENPDRRFLYSMTVAPVNFTPGTREEYSGVGYYALAYAVTRSIHGSKPDNIDAYLREKIMRPLEIPDTSWNLSYGKSHFIDDMKLYAFGSGATYTARASARIGELMLNRGIWNGQTLIKPEWIDIILARHNETMDIVSENHGWTLNIKKIWPSLPADAFAGIGGGHMITLVIPSLDLVMVRYGKTLQDENETFMEALDSKMFSSLMASVTGPSSRQ
ncbi:MAG: class C beta-lactamase-related serine hydrolase [Gammaproteobacteria bacterium]|nr:MAG: class C beta-lactamase-related serine hydrolase [Gammaproteobacteria bacterium]